MERQNNDIAICSVCGKPKEKLMKWLDGSYRKLGIMCDCEKQNMKDTEERFKQEEIQRKKSNCFANAGMIKNTFENDDKQNPELSNIMLEYANNFETNFRENKGLLLYGTVGTGKSYFASCIANRIIENGYTCIMTNFTTIINDLTKNYTDRGEVIDHLCKCSLLIIDDLGTERQSDFMKEQVFNIVNARYASGKPMIITTNLDYKEMIKETDIGRKRIYDRVIENAKVYEMKSTSRRLQKSIANNFGG